MDKYEQPKLVGFKVIDTLKNDTNWIGRCIRLKDKRKVILKVLNKTHPSLDDIKQFYHEYEILKAIEDNEVPKLEKSISRHQPSLIIEDIQGVTLDNCFQFGRLQLNLFLRIAIQLSVLLDRLHENKVIHGVLAPRHIILNKKINRLMLIDFSRSMRIDEPQFLFPLDVRDLRYLAPEQLNRSNLSISESTDLYGLGVLFYEMLNGSTPFPPQASSSDLIHFHLAKMPVDLHLSNPKIPKILSNIIMKLLSKNTKERYQSGWSLKVDLEQCLKQLNHRKKLMLFPLAQADILEKSSIFPKVYEREKQNQQLESVVNKQLKGKSSLVFLTGEPGVGKTTLINALQKMGEDKVIFANGKFTSHQGNIPHMAIIDSLRDFFRQILVESASDKISLKNILIRDLHGVIPLLIGPIPELGILLNQSINPIEPSETFLPEFKKAPQRIRFQKALCQLIRSIALQKSSLIFIWENLHWATDENLQLIGNLIELTWDQNISFLLSFRPLEIKSESWDNVLKQLQVNYIFPLEIKLSPLKESTINEMLSEVLRSPPEKTLSLAQLIFRNYNGNPLAINDFIKRLYQKRLIYFETQWEWDIEQLQDIQIDNLEILLSVFNQMNAPTQNFLKMVSCLSDGFDQETLAEVFEMDRAIVSEMVQILKEANLLETSPSNEYSFSHNGVRESLQRQISEKDKADIYLQIARHWNEKPYKNTKEVFQIAQLFSFSLKLVKDKNEKIEIAKLELAAALRAKEAGTFKEALKYCQTGICYSSNEKAVP